MSMRTHSTPQLWNEAGRMLATTHQVVYYKE